MGRILFFLVLLAVIAFWFKARQRQEQKQYDRQQAKKRVVKSVNMLECPVCRVHFVRSEGVQMNGKIYCSQTCAEKAQRGYCCDEN